MKKIIFKLEVALLLILTLNSCSLDETLYGLATTKDFVKTEADANFVVNGVYANLQTFEAFKSSTAGLILYSGDDFASAQITGSNSAGVWLNRLFNSSDPYVASAWNSFYSCINRANSAMETIDPITTIDANVRTKINGEMTFLRGFNYFYLVRLFGAVPLMTTATKPTDNFYKQRQPVDSVYKQIFADFKNATSKCLPYSKQPATEFGRATKGAAQAMLSLAYLTYANYLDMNGKPTDAQVNYQLAANWADSVILSNEYILLPNYANLYDVTNEKEAYKEVIYGIQFARDATTAGAGSKGSEWAYYTQPAERWGVSGYLLPKGRGAGQIKLQPWFVEQYFTAQYVGDYRSEVSFLTGWNGFTNTATPAARKYITFPAIATDASDLVRLTQPYLDKYRDPKGLEQRNNENDLFIMRLSEVYLIKAEASNELGKIAEAYEAFNALRIRARLANGTPRTTPLDLVTGIDKEEFRMAVYNERGLELVGEGHRFFDGVRMRYPYTNKCMLQWRLDTFYPNLTTEQKTLPVWNTTSKSWAGGRVYMLNVVTWNERFLLFPIPSTELDANPNFGLQNPGW